MVRLYERFTRVANRISRVFCVSQTLLKQCRDVPLKLHLNIAESSYVRNVKIKVLICKKQLSGIFELKLLLLKHSTHVKSLSQQTTMPQHLYSAQKIAAKYAYESNWHNVLTASLQRPLNVGTAFLRRPWRAHGAHKARIQGSYVTYSI